MSINAFTLVINMRFIFRICLLALSTLGSTSLAQSKTGRTVDEHSDPLPYVSVREEKGAWQTTSASDGTFLIPAGGERTLLLRLLGHSPLRITVNPDTLPDLWEIPLYPQAITLTLFEVSGSRSKDLAYEVMERAQAMRSTYQKQLSTYSFRAYIRGAAFVKDLPQQILGRQILIDGLDSTRSGTVYLSESMSEYYAGERGREKEIMLRSRVAGSMQGISWNSARDLQIDLYAPLIQNELTTRPLISPLAGDAGLYYSFQHLGAYYEDTLMVHKIKLIPRVKGGSAIQGIIEIQEGSWRVHAASLLLTKDQGIDVLDTLEADITFVPLMNDIWVKGTQHLRYSFQFPLFKLRGDGYFIGSFDQWKVPGNTPPGGFSSEVLHIQSDVQETNPVVWDTLRPIGLTADESEAYRRKDSLAQLRLSPEYLDSLDKKANRFKIPALIFGYTWQRSRHGVRIYLSGPASGIHFNTVEGPAINQTLRFRKYNREDRSYVQVEVQGRYGFNARRGYVRGGVRHRYNGLKESYWELSGGRYISMAGVENPVSEWVNDIYTLLLKENYPIYFAESNVQLKWESNVLPNLRVAFSGGWKWRDPLSNATNLSHWYFPWDNKAYRENTPEAYGFSPEEWTSRGLMNIRMEVVWSPGRTYSTRPNLRLFQNSAWPEMSFAVEHASGLPGEQYSSFTKAESAIRYNQRIGVLGRLLWAARIQYMIQAERLHFQDRFHYRGSSTLFTAPDFSVLSFQALPIYAHSAKHWSWQGHFRWEMGGWLLWKLPYMERLRWTEQLSVRTLWNESLPGYLEAGAGLNGIFRVLSLEGGYFSYLDLPSGGGYFRLAIGF